MPNSLTGDFEAVVQIGIRQINGILATLHARGSGEEVPLKLIHTSSLRLGESGRKLPDRAAGEWLAEYFEAHGGGGEGGFGDHLTERVPPGLAGRLKDVLADFALPDETVTSGTVRGTAHAQVSSPTISVLAGSTGEVTVHARVRALYKPDADTADLPAPIHGEIRATFEVYTVPSGGGRRLVIRPSEQDSEITFTPAAGSGLTVQDAGRISVEVRKVVREGLELLPIDLPAGFPFSTFRAVGIGPGQAIALPLQLSGTGLPAGNIQSISDSFLGTAGFAVGIGREFATSAFQPTIDQLLQLSGDVEVDVWGPNPTYHFSVTGVELEFHDATVELVIRARATHWFWPNFNNIAIRQKVALLLAFDTLFIRAMDYEPQVSGVSLAGVSLPTGAIKSVVVAQRDAALTAAESALNEELRDAKQRLDNALGEFDPALSARFRAGSSEDPTSATAGGIDIREAGIVIRGDIRAARARPAPHVEIARGQDGLTRSALPSWIPGGWIERLSWSWVTAPPFTAYGGQVSSRVEEHGFVLSIPAPPPGPLGPEIAQVCLRVEGTRILADGSVQPIAGGSSCLVSEPEVVLDAPSWWEPLTVPIWQPGRGNRARARDAIAAHASVQSESPKERRLGRNTLVYFGDGREEAPAAVIGEALGLLKRGSYSLAVIVVLPAGAFDRSRDELERLMEPARARIATSLLVTEDDEGGWTRSFAPSRLPAIYLVNARREFAWKHEGEVDARTLAAALDARLVPAPILPPRPLRLSVAPGERAPDAVFSDGGKALALRRLRGRRVVLNFWQPWSTPCLAELRRLESFSARRGGPEGEGEEPLIVALHGGKDPAAMQRIRKELGLSFFVAHDAEQRIARLYDVRCWPTTVTVDERGMVENVQFGLPADVDGGRTRPIPEHPIPAPLPG